MDPDLAGAMGLPSADGVLVSDVEPGSPAADAGIVSGDDAIASDVQGMREVEGRSGAVVPVDGGLTASSGLPNLNKFMEGIKEHYA